MLKKDWFSTMLYKSADAAQGRGRARVKGMPRRLAGLFEPAPPGRRAAVPAANAAALPFARN